MRRQRNEPTNGKQALSFTAADQEFPVFKRLSAQLKACADATGRRSLYTMALRDGQLVFGPESLDPNDPYASPPGTVYLDLPVIAISGGMRNSTINFLPIAKKLGACMVLEKPITLATLFEVVKELLEIQAFLSSGSSLVFLRYLLFKILLRLIPYYSSTGCFSI